MLSTFAEFQQQASSEKAGLVAIEGSRRLVGWDVYSGAIYSYPLVNAVISSVDEDGGSLLEAYSLSAMVAGSFYYDRADALLFVQTSDSSAPDSKSIVLTYKFFFSNVPITAPHDLADGFEVEWIPMLNSDSTFVVQIENTKNLLGVAITNSSSLKFYNDQDFWGPLFDKVTFESHLVVVYSWHRSLPVSEAQIVYKGKVYSRKYASKEVTFEVKDFLDELRSPISTALIQDLPDALVPDALLVARQRTIYGFLHGHVPTPIDQVLPSGYPLTGTMTAVNGSAAVVGSGTQFLKELNNGDELYIGTALTKVKVDSVTDDTNLVLSENFAQENQTAETGSVVPANGKRYANRIFLVAGHALSRPSYTITAVIDNSQFYLDTTDGLEEGDTLEFSTASGVIRVLGDGFVKLVSAFTVSPNIGDIVYLASVSNVYLNDTKLVFSDDYTYDEETARITLTETAEFNRALVQKVTGTIAISNGSRSVVGTGTQFRTELNVGDWIKIASKSTYFEILDVADDTNLTLRTVPGAADAGSAVALFRSPDVFNRSSVLSCDVIGKSDDSGNFIRTAGGIARDLLVSAGLEENLNVSSFTDSDELLPYRIGIAIPARMNDKSVPTIRDTLNLVCRSTFSSVILNNEFQLEMSVLEPSWLSNPTEYSEADILKFEVDSDSSQIVKAAHVTYRPLEYDYTSASASNSVADYNNTRYLSATEKEFTLATILVDDEDAEIFASRWAFLLDIATSNVTIDTGLQAARFQINDVIKLNHEKFYQRFGSADKARIGAILAITKGIGRVTLLINDLGNAFSRVARIAADDSNDYDSASSSEKVINGYMTDANELTADGVFGINLIW
jgi:hypothetical protein